MVSTSGSVLVSVEAYYIVKNIKQLVLDTKDTMSIVDNDFYRKTSERLVKLGDVENELNSTMGIISEYNCPKDNMREKTRINKHIDSFSSLIELSQKKQVPEDDDPLENVRKTIKGIQGFLQTLKMKKTTNMIANDLTLFFEHFMTDNPDADTLWNDLDRIKRHVNANYYINSYITSHKNKQYRLSGDFDGRFEITKEGFEDDEGYEFRYTQLEDVPKGKQQLKIMAAYATVDILLEGTLNDQGTIFAEKPRKIFKNLLEDHIKKLLKKIRESKGDVSTNVIKELATFSAAHLKLTNNNKYVNKIAKNKFRSFTESKTLSLIKILAVRTANTTLSSKFTVQKIIDDYINNEGHKVISSLNDVVRSNLHIILNTINADDNSLENLKTCIPECERIYQEHIDPIIQIAPEIYLSCVKNNQKKINDFIQKNTQGSDEITLEKVQLRSQLVDFMLNTVLLKDYYYGEGINQLRKKLVTEQQQLTKLMKKLTSNKKAESKTSSKIFNIRNGASFFNRDQSISQDKKHPTKEKIKKRKLLGNINNVK